MEMIPTMMMMRMMMIACKKQGDHELGRAGAAAASGGVPFRGHS